MGLGDSEIPLYENVRHLVVNHGLYCCINCHGTLSISGGHLLCAICKRTYPVVNDIPYFLSDPLLTKANSVGLASRLFESPFLYDHLVNLKTLVAPDQPLGIRDLTDGHSLLNIGCGSNAKGKHMEYDIQVVSNFAAVDVSWSFIETAKKNCGRKDADFCVASIDNLPYADSSFDVAIIGFVLHHLSSPLDIAIQEAVRVARHQVVIFDHVKSEKSIFINAIQCLYWRIFDGGHQYLTDSKWKAVLKDRRITRMIRTGAIGKHVIKFVLEKEG
jgi:SAM-dependent methyltransferase